MGREEMQKYYQKLHDAQQELVGCEAPLFAAIDMKGDSVKLEELRGKIVILNFWFIACPPCIAEIPGLKQIAEEFGTREDVVMIALGTDGKEAQETFLKKKDFGFQMIPDARDYADKFRITGFPTTMVLDREGKVFSVHIGGATNEKQASRLIYKALSKDIKKNP